ncbi:MAG: hypothetical protein HOJ35_12925 [Bdellovibrionales bacterium]|jgi:hypothetical protein|nr:hypothetical protein [Bdellovibrionales bacterium]
MIYNVSEDPVLIKKISLELWLLRSEVESNVKRLLEDGQNDPTNLVENYEKSIAENQSEVSPSQIINGSTFLSEVEEDKILLFSEKKLIIGQSIVINFLIPSPFKLHATITYCRKYQTKGNVIAVSKLPYRVQATFNLVEEAEIISIANFIESIKDIQGIKVKTEAIEEEIEEEIVQEVEGETPKPE